MVVEQKAQLRYPAKTIKSKLRSIAYSLTWDIGIFKITRRQINSYINTNMHIIDELDGNIYERYFPTIGILRPMPKAFGETLKIGGV